MPGDDTQDATTTCTDASGAAAAAHTASEASSSLSVSEMIKACTSCNVDLVRNFLEKYGNSAASLQDETTGQSPLMAASAAGHIAICQELLDAGAPWNAVDRKGQCAGNYATNAEHWEVVNLLVEVGTRAELILGASIRALKEKEEQNGTATSSSSSEKPSSPSKRPVEQEPCTKPDYLQRNVRYNTNGMALLDEDGDAVMMEWERPLMDAHASIITSDGKKGKRVMNVGFGMGIVDAAIQRFEPALHIIVEAHPDVHAKMIRDGWSKKSGVRIEFGRWQDVVPKLIEEGVELDGIFYDTYGEHFIDLEVFHEQMVRLLAKPGGIYSFFNGLAPDNLFFHGVACQCVKLQLAKLGLDTEFAQCQIQVKEKDWEGVRRKYWHGRETYYLPIATWNKDALTNEAISGNNKKTKEQEDDCNASKSANESIADPESKRAKT